MSSTAKSPEATESNRAASAVGPTWRSIRLGLRRIVIGGSAEPVTVALPAVVSPATRIKPFCRPCQPRCGHLRNS